MKITSGCDFNGKNCTYVGTPWKGGGRGNWRRIFLCPNCVDEYKKANKK